MVRRKPPALRAHALNYPAAVSARYSAKLDKAVARMTRQVRRELEKLFKSPVGAEHFAQDASISSQARILTNALMEKFDDFFRDFAKDAAKVFASDVNRASASSTAFSLKDLSQGLTIKASSVVSGPVKEALSASVTENVGLIKSIPAQYLTQVQAAVMRSISSEQGLAYLVPFLEKQEGITKRRANLIAMDQTRKVYSNLNAIRMQDAGVVEYEWLHSRSSLHPREYHKKVLDGKTFRWDTPPVIDEETGERGHPGQLINCRCNAIPVISFRRAR